MKGVPWGALFYFKSERRRLELFLIFAAASRRITTRLRPVHILFTQTQSNYCARLKFNRQRIQLLQLRLRHHLANLCTECIAIFRLSERERKVLEEHVRPRIERE